MRRPAPLPSDPDAPPRATGAGDAVPAAETAADAAERPEARPDLPVDAHEADPHAAAHAQETEPVDGPLLLTEAFDAAESTATNRDADETEPDVEPEPGEIGMREVWAAARARRKVLRAEVRRFTVRQRRRRYLWLGVIGVFVLLVAGTVGAAYSPLFAVERVRVTGTSALDAGEVEEALSGQLGVPLASVDSSQVKAALVQFPLVETYTLQARPPHELLVQIVERTPIGSIRSAAGYTLVDAAGVALSTTPQPAEGYPSIEVPGSVSSKPFHAVGTVYRALPDDVRAQVTAMSATSANDVTLTLGGTRTQVVWGNADRSAYKAEVLARAMIARPPADVWVYDVSAPDVVVVR